MTLHVRPQRLDVARDAGDEPAAADRHEDRRRRRRAVAQDLVRRSVPCPAITQRIVERMDEASCPSLATSSSQCVLASA